jgi:hypothetical protein
MSEKERFAEAVADAYWSSNEQRLRELCRRYEVTVEPARGSVTIKAVPFRQPHSMPLVFVSEAKPS